MPVPEPPHILVVDDEPEIRTLLVRCFTREGYRVSEAKGGAELWARLGQGPVSLVTLDIKLGGEDGLELARELGVEHVEFYFLFTRERGIFYTNVVNAKRINYIRVAWGEAERLVVRGLRQCVLIRVEIGVA